MCTWRMSNLSRPSKSRQNIQKIEAVVHVCLIIFSLNNFLIASLSEYQYFHIKSDAHNRLPG